MRAAKHAAWATAAVAACALLGCLVVLASSGSTRSAVELESSVGRGDSSDDIKKLGADIARGKVSALFSLGTEDVGACTSWRGCPATPKELVPEEVTFQCGGEEPAMSCVQTVKKCTAAAEADALKLFETQPKVATELRAQHNCKCFVSNGCKPTCNVAMYMIWSSGNNMRCSSQPPVYMKGSGAYLYGDPYSKKMLSTDLSYDYFPDYPNPAGHIMNVPYVRHTYAQDPKTNFEYPTLPRSAGYSAYEPPRTAYVPLVEDASAYYKQGVEDASAYYMNQPYAMQQYAQDYLSASSMPASVADDYWADAANPAAIFNPPKSHIYDPPRPSSIYDGYWAQHNLDHRPYNSWTGEGKTYAPYAEAYYYYDPESGHVYLQ